MKISYYKTWDRSKVPLGVTSGKENIDFFLIFSFPPVSFHFTFLSFYLPFPLRSPFHLFPLTFALLSFHLPLIPFHFTSPPFHLPFPFRSPFFLSPFTFPPLSFHLPSPRHSPSLHFPFTLPPLSSHRPCSLLSSSPRSLLLPSPFLSPSLPYLHFSFLLFPPTPQPLSSLLLHS